MSLSFLSLSFDGANQSGAAMVAGLGASKRYNLLRPSTLSAWNLHKRISSATVYSSSTVDSTVIYFGSLVPFLTFPDFSGWFLQITNRKGSGSEFDVNNFSSHGFNNKATSAMLVGPQKGFELRFSFRDMFLQKWKTTIDAELGGSASRKGDPSLGWEVFPIGISHLNSSHMYLRIFQKLRINIPLWPDYDAWIKYHIRLYLDGSGRLKGYVARWEYWIEGGIKTGSIESKLKPAVISGMNTINAKLGEELEPYSGFSFEDLYLLPGNQTTRPPTGVIVGSVFDDATIVVQL